MKKILFISLLFITLGVNCFAQCGTGETYTPSTFDRIEIYKHPMKEAYELIGWVDIQATGYIVGYFVPNANDEFIFYRSYNDCSGAIETGFKMIKPEKPSCYFDVYHKDEHIACVNWNGQIKYRKNTLYRL